jgi:transcriptional regulator with XRE-family HTH domain
MPNKHSQDSPAGRLKLICKMEGITQKELADSVGMSLRGFATILGEKSKVSQTLALAVEARFGYRADWILTGEGSQKRNFDDEKSPIQRFKLFLTDDPYGLLLKELFFRKTLEPLILRQEKYLIQSEKSLEHRKIYQEKIKDFSKLEKN